jgi:hypothetical protein
MVTSCRQSSHPRQFFKSANNAYPAVDRISGDHSGNSMLADLKTGMPYELSLMYSDAAALISLEIGTRPLINHSRSARFAAVSL